jgi:hypothetical protein
LHLKAVDIAKNYKSAETASDPSQLFFVLGSLDP